MTSKDQGHTPRHEIIDLFIPFLKWIVDNRRRIYLGMIILFFLALISAILGVIAIKKMIVFLLMVMVGGYLNYIIIRYHLRIDFTPIFFFTIIIGHHLGFLWAVLYLFVAETLTFFPAKSTPGPMILMYQLLALLLLLIPFSPESLLVGGVLLSFLNGLGRFMINLIFGIDPIGIFSILMNFAVNAYFFARFSEALISVLI